MKKTKGFVPSGLDEVFANIAKRKAEAIAAGWIKPPKRDEPKKQSAVIQQ